MRNPHINGFETINCKVQTRYVFLIKRITRLNFVRISLKLHKVHELDVAKKDDMCFFLNKRWFHTMWAILTPPPSAIFSPNVFVPSIYGFSNIEQKLQIHRHHIFFKCCHFNNNVFIRNYWHYLWLIDRYFKGTLMQIWKFANFFVFIWK